MKYIESTIYSLVFIQFQLYINVIYITYILFIVKI